MTSMGNDIVPLQVTNVQTDAGTHACTRAQNRGMVFCEIENSKREESIFTCDRCNETRSAIISGYFQYRKVPQQAIYVVIGKPCRLYVIIA